MGGGYHFNDDDIPVNDIGPINYLELESNQFDGNQKEWNGINGIQFNLKDIGGGSYIQEQPDFIEDSLDSD